MEQLYIRISDTDAALIAGLFEREIVNNEDQICQAREDLHWNVRYARFDKLRLAEPIDPRLPDADAERQHRQKLLDLRLQNIRDTVNDIRQARDEINLMKRLGRRLGYDL